MRRRARCSSSTSSRDTPDRKVHLFPEALDREAPGGLYAYQPDPATAASPLALISPATDRTISSTFGQLAAARSPLEMHPDDAARAASPTAIACASGTTLRRGALPRCGSTPTCGRASRVLPKGLWAATPTNGATANALAPDTLTDLGGGACFNDARVEVERLG